MYDYHTLFLYLDHGPDQILVPPEVAYSHYVVFERYITIAGENPSEYLAIHQNISDSKPMRLS